MQKLQDGITRELGGRMGRRSGWIWIRGRIQDLFSSFFNIAEMHLDNYVSNKLKTLFKSMHPVLKAAAEET